MLRNTEGCRYITLSASVDVANDRVRVYKKKSRNKENVSGPSTNTVSDTDFEEVEEETCEDDDVCRYVQNVVKALKIGDDEILLGVAWTTKDGYVSHMRFHMCSVLM